MAAVERLTLEEVQLLKPLELERLERREFPVNTAARRHFVQVCQGKAEPETQLERAYLKWRVSKPDLDLLGADLLMLTAKAQRLAEKVRSARGTRAAAARAEKEKRAAKTARLE